MIWTHVHVLETRFLSAHQFVDTLLVLPFFGLTIDDNRTAHPVFTWLHKLLEQKLAVLSHSWVVHTWVKRNKADIYIICAFYIYIYINAYIYIYTCLRKPNFATELLNGYERIMIFWFQSCFLLKGTTTVSATSRYQVSFPFPSTLPTSLWSAQVNQNLINLGTPQIMKLV